MCWCSLERAQRDAAGIDPLQYLVAIPSPFSVKGHVQDICGKFPFLVGEGEGGWPFASVATVFCAG